MDEARRARGAAALEKFLTTSLDALVAHRASTDPFATALERFRTTAREVPAYRAFLAEHGVDPGELRSADAFERLPPMTKDGYLKRHPLSALVKGGRLAALDTIAVSSGSTGEPLFWPRSLADELAIAVRFEELFVDSFRIDEKSTLAVVCFPLGTWVGGMFTAACCRHLATKGYPLFTVTPGNVKAEILRVVKELAPSFDQVVLLGYPPFLKDVVDSGVAAGVRWDGCSIKLVLAGEVFTEEWRTLMAARAGMQQPLLDSASLYGTADAGVLGHETPVSIAIRRFLASRPEDARAFFGEPRLPTLVQFDPHTRFIEEHDGRLLFTGDNGIPLVRYDIGDNGGVVPFASMIERVRLLGFDPIAAAEGAGARVVRELPFVYVFGRAHFAVSYFGANLFPEMISVGLEQPEVVQRITGKFVMQVVTDSDQNAELTVAIELAPGAEADPALADTVARSILGQLLRLDREFATYVPRDRQLPRILLRAAGDPEYFPAGVKHRYSRR